MSNDDDNKSRAQFLKNLSDFDMSRRGSTRLYQRRSCATTATQTPRSDANTYAELWRPEQSKLTAPAQRFPLIRKKRARTKPFYRRAGFDRPLPDRT